MKGVNSSMTKEELINLIDEEDVEFIRLQFTDVLGNLKNIAVTPGQMERVLNRKYAFSGSALFDDLVEYSEDLYLQPDLDTFVILPWRPQHGKVGKIICDVCESDGTLSKFSPRTVLKEITDKARKLGYEFDITPECEFFLFHTDDNGNPTTISHEKAGYLDVGPVDFGENARRDMVLTLEDMGFEIESSHHEKAPAQHEIDFTDAESLKAADDIVTFKFAVRSIAKRFGLYATFMPKPRFDQAGSGMHLKFGVSKNGKALFEEGNEEVTEEAKYFIGGIMAHAEALCAITNPIVNSYKRLSSGFDAPSSINWSAKGEKSLIKFTNCFGEKKIELRFPDPSANPYLAIAACIAAGLDGIENKISPEEAEEVTRKLPGNLNDAIRHLRADEVICRCLGDELVKEYMTIKKNEWNEYMMQVSDWEIEKYLVKM